MPRAGPELIRRDLCDEAIRVGELLIDCPATDRPECHALLALMHLQAARFPARMNGEGDMLLLREQDRSRWDPRLLARGFEHLARSAEGDEITAYHVEAGIAACHAAAPSYAATDWSRIVELYDQLLGLKPTAVIALNHAVALSRLAGPRPAIERIAAIAAEPALAKYHLLHAVLGELWTEAGDLFAARREYELALRSECSEPERRFLHKKLARLES